LPHSSIDIHRIGCRAISHLTISNYIAPQFCYFNTNDLLTPQISPFPISVRTYYSWISKVEWRLWFQIDINRYAYPIKKCRNCPEGLSFLGLLHNTRCAIPKPPRKKWRRRQARVKEMIEALKCTILLRRENFNHSHCRRRRAEFSSRRIRPFAQYNLLPLICAFRPLNIQLDG